MQGAAGVPGPANSHGTLQETMQQALPAVRAPMH